MAYRHFAATSKKSMYIIHTFAEKHIALKDDGCSELAGGGIWMELRSEFI